jgi:hypothetical protein
MSFALVALATLTATMPTHDADHYGNNQINTLRTDGIPDILNEAHFGAQFFLNSWKLNGRQVGPKNPGDSGMITGVGDFGKDHGWWGRPENQDAMTELGRGGYKERILRSELGANTLGDVAAALAILSKRWRPYDAKWADTALMAAKDMYNWAKNHRVVVASAAYNGSGPDKVNANLALAATALLWVTHDKTYLNDIAYDKTIGTKGAAYTPKASWEGGWMVMSNPNLDKGGANTDWANRHAVTLYTFYKLILADKDSALLYGVSDEAERQNLIAHTIQGVVRNLSGISTGGSGINIPLPSVDPNENNGYAIKASSDWFVMYTQQEWVWNRYHIANAVELYFYYDITKDLEAGTAGTSFTQYQWNRDQVRQLMIRILDYQLGDNPWDLSMIFGIGKKNFNHPHHRAANPEGRNTPGASYGYHSPVGALFGSWDPTGTNDATAPTNTRDYFDYKHSEVCLDGAAASMLAFTGLAQDVPLNIPPHATVKVVYVSDTLAQIQIELDKYGSTQLDLGLAQGAYTRTVKADSVGVTFVFKVGGLKPGTQYFFDVVSKDLQGNAASLAKWDNPLPDGTPFSFTTRATPQGKAQIENVKVCNVTADSAEIMWYTPNGEYQSSICWGRSPTQDTTWRCAEDIDVSGHPVKFHYVKIGGLQEKTDYWFKVGSDGIWDDNQGAYYKFRTPVKMANFSVFAVQYAWGGMPALAINVINNEARNYDSLSVRVYVRSKDTVGTHIVQDSLGVLRTVPMAFVDAMAARYDICQAYDGAGFNKPCDDPTWGITWSWGDMNRSVQMLRPTKMPETTDPVTGTSVYYFDLPLGPTMMKQQSRIRFDVIFAVRSEYEKALNQSQLDILRWAKAFLPSIPNYQLGDKGWFDVMDQPFTLHPMGKDSSNDWSFVAHSTANGDPLDFVGIPRVATQTEASALIDNISDQVPLDPYITVYRKGEFVYGFSPSYIEQAQKKTYWGVDVELKSPFNLPNGSTITLDQTSSTVHVKGTADVYDKLIKTAKGVVSDIWVNGARLTPAQVAAAAKWNATTKLWDLDIPVKMAIGGQSIDVTIFGGLAACPDTVVVCSGGCAFFDAEYFVQFSRGNSTQSVLSLLKADGSVYPAKTAPDSLALAIRLADKDQSKKGSLGATVQVTVSNPLRAYSKAFTLMETADTGVFQFAGLSLTAKTTGLLPSEIPFQRGDTLWFWYHDPLDPDDSSFAFVWSEAAWPLPLSAGLFRDCAGNYKVKAMFDKAFGGAAPWQDAVLTLTSSAGDSVGVVKVPAAQIAKGTGFQLVFSVPAATVGIAQSGRLAIPVSDGRGGWIDTRLAVSDSIGPWMDSVSIVENVLGQPEDTAYFWISEKVRNLSTTSFVIHRTGLASPLAGVDSIRSLDANGRSWMLFVKHGSLALGDSIGLLSTSTVRDLSGNAPSECANQVRPVTLVPRPAPFARAWILDSNGDGLADQVKLVYRKTVGASDVPDSLDLVFGSSLEKRTVKVSAAMATDSVLTVPLPFPFGWGSTRGTNADGSGSVALWQSGSRSSAAALADSVGPVLLTATVRYGVSVAFDTLALTFSEPVQAGAGTGWLTVQSGAALGASDPVAVSTTLWLLPVPAGSVSSGDSVKPLPTQRWVDVASLRHAPIGHLWIPVSGGDRAPLFGWFTDENGDGAADHIHVQFGAVLPKTRPGMVFTYNSGATISVDSGAWDLAPGGSTTTLAIGPLPQGMTSFGTAPKGTWKSMGSGTAFPLYDSVAPVLVSATLRYASKDSIPDTLKVRWSEALKGTDQSPLVQHMLVGASSDVLGAALLDADGLGASILVLADSAGFVRGDSARLAPASKHTATDLFGNASESGVWVPIKMGARPIRLDFTSKTYVEIPLDDPSVTTKGMVVVVRPRPERGSADTLWSTLDGTTPPSEDQSVNLTMTVNRPLEGSAYLFDNSGVFVAALDLSPLVKLSEKGLLPTDPSGMVQVRVAWNGRDPQGRLVSSGIYRMRLVLKDGGGDTGEPIRIVNKVYTFGIKRPAK